MQCIVISYNMIKKVSQAWMKIVGDFIGLAGGHLSLRFIILNSFLNIVISVLSPSLEREIPLNLFFLPPTRRGLRSTPVCHFKIRAIVLFGEGREILEKLPASLVTAPSVNIFKERPSVDQGLSPSPRITSFWADHSSSQFLISPASNISPLDIYHCSLCYQIPRIVPRRLKAKALSGKMI